METSNSMVLRGPRDVLGSEVTLVQNAEGLWNATLMGKQGGRSWDQYYRKRGADTDIHEFVNECASQLGVPVSSIVKTEPVAGVPRGHTWIHKRIALKFLAHQSPKFANWAFGVLERYLGGDITTEESKAVQKETDALLEEHRIRYQEAQRQLAEKQKQVESERKEHFESVKRINKRWEGEVEDKLQEQKKEFNKKINKGDRAKANQKFLEDLRTALAQWSLDYPDHIYKGDWEEVEKQLGEKDGTPVNLRTFAEHLADWGNGGIAAKGKDWASFGKTWTVEPQWAAHAADWKSTDEFSHYEHFSAMEIDPPKVAKKTASKKRPR